MASKDAKTTGLIAILLVTRTRPGPKIVFCYPPNPKKESSLNRSSENGIDLEDSNSESDNNGMPTPLRQIVADNTDWSNGGTKSIDQTGSDGVEGDGIFCFSEDSLEKLLSPGCWCDRQKFEVSLDGLVYIGHPIYAAQDGSWAHKHTHETTPRKRATQKTSHSKSNSAPAALEKPDLDIHEPIGITITEPKTPARTDHDFKHVPESFESHGLSLGTSMNSGSTTSAAVPEPLMSFNVVVVMRANGADKSSNVASDMHTHIVKKLSKALHYCQKHSSYVGKQSRTLTTFKAKAKQEKISKIALCQQLIESSELAWALKEVYDKISIGAVADIRVDEKEMSLSLPTKSVDPEFELDLHAGILLLEDKETLVRELAHSDASPLVYFIREHTPTKSLQKLSTKIGMSTEQAIYLARYLIAWQKARAISPLHRHNIYVLSPDAPLNDLQHHTVEYSRLFPVLPSLPQILSWLSGPPLRYASRILSRDHREPFMDILAYLVRHRFVHQLKTSGWLRAPSTLVQSATKETENRNRLPLSVASLLSPQLRPVDDDVVSVSSERTAIPLSKADLSKKRSPATNGAKAADALAEQDSESFELIKCPLNLSTEDKKRLQHIQAVISDLELADRLPSLARYFDGEFAFEDIAAREGFKRSRVDAWLDQLQENGFLLTFRHP